MIKTLRRGFTLIELLVVIAIIGILASIIIVNLSTSRAKGRDAVRKSDLHQIKNALEIYASDNDNLYPPSTYNAGSCNGKPYLTSNTDCATGSSWSSAGVMIYDALTGELSTNQALSVVPNDPKNDATYHYIYQGLGCGDAGCTSYILLALLEVPSDITKACWQDSISVVGPVSGDNVENCATALSVAP